MDSYLRTKLHLPTLPAALPPPPPRPPHPPPPLAGLLPSVEMRLQGLFASGHASHEVKETYYIGKRDQKLLTEAHTGYRRALSKRVTVSTRNGRSRGS